MGTVHQGISAATMGAPAAGRRRTIGRAGRWLAVAGAVCLLAGTAAAAPSDDVAAPLGAAEGLVVASVNAGTSHTCGVRADGAVACWGDDGEGQASPPAGTFTQVSAGDFHTCGLHADGTVACWGFNVHNQASPPAGTFTQVSAGSGYTCGLRADGAVACWGYNRDGQASPPAGTFTQVSAGGSHTCGVGADGAVACWGYDAHGRASPPAGTFTQVSAGGSHTCGLRSDGAVACWGNDGDGQSNPAAGTFTQVSAGGSHTCGLRSDGAVACWGNDGDGQSNPAVTSAAPPHPELGAPYAHQFTTTHMRPGPVFAVTAGTLPDGMGLSGAGLLTGPVAEGGSFPLTVCASNGLAPDACQSFTLVVEQVQPAMATTASAGGMVGTPVRATSVVSGGSAPTGTVTFRLFSDAGCSTEVFSSTVPLVEGTATSEWATPGAPGTYEWTATYSGDGANLPATSGCGGPGQSVVITAFQAPPPTSTLSGDVVGPVTVASGESVLLSGARVVGPVTVQPGGALTVVGSTVSGGIFANAPTFFSLCGADVSRDRASGVALSVMGAPVAVRVGDPGAGCAGNRLAGHAVVSSNLAVSFRSNTVTSNATLDGNGPGATVAGGNTVWGMLSCTGNDPAPVNGGDPNTAAARLGQCATL
jgi:hypothetical protein